VKFIDKKAVRALMTRPLLAAGALILLKRKKLYSTDVERISNMIMNVDVQLHAVEGAVSNVGYAKTVGATAGILKAVGQEMDAEKVDDLVADLKESLADQDDVNSALAEELGPHVDESEVRCRKRLHLLPPCHPLVSPPWFSLLLSAARIRARRADCGLNRRSCTCR
jgi:hypothetical protein